MRSYLADTEGKLGYDGSLADCSAAATLRLRRERRRVMTRTALSGMSSAAGHGSSQAKTAEADEWRNDRK
jgi:hypothetical protein